MFVNRFSTLLTSVLVVSFSGNAVVDALPVPPAGLITLPLQRASQARADLHPQILLQQHINRGNQRLARMTGALAPTTEELVDNLHKRMYLTAGGPGSHTYQPEKRYNAYQPSVPAPSPEVDVDLKELATVPIPTEFKALAKGAAVDASTTPSANSLGLDIIANDVGYFATVQMGTPPRDFKVLMDSGSADLWVGGENCKSQSANGGGCGNHTFLGTQSSSSFVDTQSPFSVTYGTGQVSGTKVTDDMNIAGLALSQHDFGVAQVETPDFSDNSVPFDGLMGLALSALSEQKVLTPPEAMAQAGLIKEAIVSYKISRSADQKNDGEITFGGLDGSKFDPNTLVTLASNSKSGFWSGAMDAVTVNGKSVQAQTLNAILDTGTTLIIAPDADANAVHAAIPGSRSDGQGGFVIPCDTTAKVGLSFGGQSFEIDTRDLAFAQLSANSNDCVSGISSGNIGGGGAWLVGDVFLKNAYFSTNASKKEFSLAKLV